MKNFKRSLAVLLSAALLVSALVVPGMLVSAEAELDVWDGTSVAPADSDNDGVYEVSTPEELAWAVKNSGGKSYILTTDIYLNDPAAVNWATGAVNEGYEPKEWYEGTTAFSGSFDGNGHVVYGLYYPVGNNSELLVVKNAGLFPSVSTGTTIKNLGIKNSYLESKGFVGPLIGYFSDKLEMRLTIDNCFTDDTVTVIAYEPKANSYTFGAGGLIGGFYNSGNITITNCYSSANTSAFNADNSVSARNGKIVGDIWLAGDDWATKYVNLVIKNCYTYGGKPCPGSKQATFTSYENVFSTAAPASNGPWTQVSAANMTGSAAASNMAGLGKAFCITAKTPALKLFVGVSETSWGGFRDSNLEGEGTTENPYLVYTAEQLAYAINSGVNKVFQMQNDIVLNDIVVKTEDGVGVIYKADGETPADKSTLIPWASGSFPGTIDGNGYVVHGMYFEGEVQNPTSETDWQKCFAFIQTAANTTVVKNLGLEDSYVRYEGGTAAGFVGYIHALAASVQNSYVGSSVYLEGYNVGGILGSGDAGKLGADAIKNCYVTATLNATGESKRWGALYGDVWSFAANCTISNVYSTSQLATTVVSCVTGSYGTATKTTGYIGSIHDGNTMYLGDAFRYVENDLPVLKVFDHDDNMGWGGLGNAVFAGGNGSEATPYQISDASQLAYMVRLGGQGKYYELVNDIVITDLDAVNWSTGEVKDGVKFKPVRWFGGITGSGDQYGNLNAATNYQRFSGGLDGNGYKISGIYYEPYYTGRDIEAEGKWLTSVGLIPAVTTSTITDIMLTDSYISGGRFTGGVVGHATNSTINNVVVDNTVTLMTTNVGLENEGKAFESYSTGAILGYAHGSFNMDNCGTSAKIICAGHLNGLVGTQWGTKVTITNSYCVGYKPIAAAGGGGTNTLTNVYGDVTASADPAVTTLETAQITGKNALDNMPGLDATFWYGVSGQGPLPRAYGERITDISCDGKFEKNSEAEALRVGLITGAELLFADVNGDNAVNVLDLVSLFK